jgi:hypothetical protein
MPNRWPSGRDVLLAMHTGKTEQHAVRVARLGDRLVQIVHGAVQTDVRRVIMDRDQAMLMRNALDKFIREQDETILRDVQRDTRPR